ncbi:MAG TPA: uroporphyrinogen decarboxylase family protein [Thermodesulfobacteriota bacterium]|nr:uroporphyrinogen decarboxylase family protein [Thermodesulfobacteriota bacterium]
MMTHKERMLKAARGEWAGQLPWAPRIDLWHNSNSMRGTLPPPFKQDATLDEVADYIGGGYHKVVPEFLNVRSPEDNIDRGLGIYRLWGMAYRPELAGVDREVKKEGDTTLVTYHTPIGSVSCKILYTEEMKRAGASITWISEHVIKEPKDYRTVGYIFKNMKIYPDYGNYLDYQRKVGDKGYAAAFANLASSPMHHIMKEFLEPTKFYLELYDHPKELQQLSEDMESYYDQIYEILSDSPAEVVFSGGNYDEMITYPPFFKHYILPHLQKLAGILHPKGKLLQTHCDGENKGLLDLLAESGMDIAEAVCPQPMTKVTITEVKKAFKGKITIFGGVPSVVLLEESMSDKEFENFMKNLFKEIAPGDRFILGVSDTTPPDAKFERLSRITEMVQEWGKLPMDL